MFKPLYGTHINKVIAFDWFMFSSETYTSWSMWGPHCKQNCEQKKSPRITFHQTEQEFKTFMYFISIK